MITVNDVYKGDIVLNPKYIANMKKTNPNVKVGLKGAKTWINYIEPEKHAVHYYVRQPINEI